MLPNPNVHINQAPTAIILDGSGQAATTFQITELPAVTHSSAPDTASGKVSFVDINVGDAPTVSTKFDSFAYQNAAHTDVTATLSAQQLADIAAVEAKLAVVPDSRQQLLRLGNLDLQRRRRCLRLPRQGRDADADLRRGSQ